MTDVAGTSHVQLSTEAVHPAARVSYWRDAVRQTVVALDCLTVHRDRFCGRVSSHDAGGLNLSRVDADAQTVKRTRTLIAQASGDAMLISLLIRGNACVRQDGRQALVAPGDLVLKDPTRPYEMLFDGHFEKWVLKAPRSALRQRLVTPEAMTAICVSGATPLGRLTHDFLVGFAVLPQATPALVQERLAGQALDLIAMAFSEHTASRASYGAHRTVLLVRMRSFVEQNLHRADLSGALIADAFRMSARSVREIFAADGSTPSRYILMRRLERARILLNDPSQYRRKINEIAYAVGMSDLARFSRSFRAAYGYSPRDARKTAEFDARRRQRLPADLCE